MDGGVNVNHGGADGYFDVGFDDEAFERVGVSPEEMSTISVHVDAATGEVTLNRCYEPRSLPGRAEAELFHRHREEIVTALHAYLAEDDAPAHAAFLATQAAAGPVR